MGGERESNAEGRERETRWEKGVKGNGKQRLSHTELEQNVKVKCQDNRRKCKSEKKITELNCPKL